MEKFIESIEADSAQYGICKIVPPSTWKPCTNFGQDKDMFIGRTDQEFTRDTMVSGFYSGTLTPLRKQTVREFQQEAEKSTSMRKSDAQDALAGIEKAYWKGIPGHTIYGADNEGSLFDKNIKVHHFICRVAWGEYACLKVMVAAGVEPCQLGLLPVPRSCIRPLRP